MNRLYSALFALAGDSLHGPRPCTSASASRLSGAGALGDGGARRRPEHTRWRGDVALNVAMKPHLGLSGSR